METSATCVDRKRKIQAELLGLPPLKHACGSESFDLEYGKRGDSDHVIAIADYSEVESGKDSNSITDDTDSSILTSCDAETGESSQSKESASELQSASSRQRCSNCSSFGLYSDISVTDDHDLSVHLPLNIGECVQESGFLVYGCCLECSESVKGLEESLYARELAKSSVLASGEWTVDHDAERNTKKLTIDKEFENYFSALML